MELRYIKDFRSINSFESYTLPDFVLVTGVNGSGKTHLLQAISSGSIDIDGIACSQDTITYYDWNTLAPRDTQELKVANLPDSSNIFNSIQQQVAQLRSQIISTCGRYGISKQEQEQICDSLEIPSLEIQHFKQFSNEIRVNISKTANNIRATLSATTLLDGLDDSAVIQINVDLLRDLPIAFSSGDSLFQQSFALAFLRYYELERDNKLNRLDYQEGNVDSAYLSQEEFVTNHGRPPWEVVNDILKTANLDFSVTYPKGNTVKSFAPMLLKNSTGTEVNFSQLSSGEKILISFAFCVFHATDKRINVKKPKLMLLDEVDATLHPTMSRQLMDVILQNIIEKEGIKVIMATHSPSTVAVAPEGNVFLKQPDISTLEPISKTKAMNVLTDGVPTLAIDFSGRRQVFVESDQDAERYDLIYQMHKSTLMSELSLAFIGAGLKKKNGGDIGSGCGAVTKTVSSLRDEDNTKIFGLIDWDCEPNRSETEAIKVLGKEYWHSIENCLCDPLLVALSLLRIAPMFLHNTCDLDVKITYTSLINMEQPELQQIANLIQSKVLRCQVDELDYDFIEFGYHGGFSVKVSKRYCQYRGHDLVEKIIDSFYPLQSYKKDADKYLKFIIEQPLRENMLATPTLLLDVYRSLLS